MTVGMKFDSEKVDYTLVDVGADEEFAGVLTFGAIKYEPGNWKKVLKEKYYGAARRHMVDWKRGILLDPETGNLHHLACAICSLHFLLALDICEELVSSFKSRFPGALRMARELRAKRLASEASRAAELDAMVEEKAREVRKENGY